MYNWSVKINKWSVLAFVGVSFCLLMSASGQIESIDGMSSLNMARNMIVGGDWNVSAPKYGIGGGTTDINAEGKYYSAASKGYAIAMLPVVWEVNMFYQAKHFVPTQYFPLDSDYLLTFWASFVNPILGIILFIVLYQFYLLVSGNKKTALTVALLTSLTTNLWPLAKHSFPNLLVTLELVIILWMTTLWFKSKKWWALLIIGMAVAILAISYNLSWLVLMLIPGYLCLDYFWQSKRMKSTKLVVVSLGFFLFFVVFTAFMVKMGGIVWLKELFNGEGTKKDFFEAIWGMILSPGRSWLVFSPIAILAVVEAFSNWKKSVWSRVFILGTMSVVGFYALFDIWSGELSFGPRYLAPLIPLAGLVLVENWKNINKKWLVGLAIFGVYVQLVGITIPYETQYQGMSLGNFNESTIANRQDQFDYWKLGEFLPQYSPIYRLKKNLVHRWLIIPRLYMSSPDMVFAGGATLPLDDNSRLIGDSVSIFTKKALSFGINQIDLGDSILNSKIFEVCVDNGCFKKGKIEVGADSLVTINFIASNSRHRITKLLLGSNSVDMASSKLLLEDSYFNPIMAKSDDRNVLYQRYYDLKAVANMTADFWWVRQKIWF